VIAYAAAALVGLWGVAHAVPTRQVVRGFGPISRDNRRVLIGMVGRGIHDAGYRSLGGDRHRFGERCFRRLPLIVVSDLEGVGGGAPAGTGRRGGSIAQLRMLST
jgi:hypothetical protein